MDRFLLQVENHDKIEDSKIDRDLIREKLDKIDKLHAELERKASKTTPKPAPDLFPVTEQRTISCGGKKLVIEGYSK